MVLTVFVECCLVNWPFSRCEAPFVFGNNSNASEAKDAAMEAAQVSWWLVIHIGSNKNHVLQKEQNGCFRKWWYPQNTPKWSFLVGKPMVVGYHHFRKPPNRLIYVHVGNDHPEISRDIQITRAKWFPIIQVSIRYLHVFTKSTNLVGFVRGDFLLCTHGIHHHKKPTKKIFWGNWLSKHRFQANPRHPQGNSRRLEAEANCWISQKKSGRPRPIHWKME